MSEQQRSSPGTVQSWAVTVSVNGDQILTIGHNHLSGIENIDDYSDAVENCAQHLFSFITGRSGAAQSSQEPVAWTVLSDETGNVRIWWRTKEPAEAWATKHKLTLTPLYAVPPSPVAGEWQPIETAPLDGTIVDVWCASLELDGRATDCAFMEGAWCWQTIGGEWKPFMACEPTHWRPLPTGLSVSSTHSEAGK